MSFIHKAQDVLSILILDMSLLIGLIYEHYEEDMNYAG
jgi:hypothetical protein